METLQLAIVGLLVLGAACYLSWSIWRAWKISKGGCGGGCGCAKAAPPAEKDRTIIPVEEITLRTRRWPEGRS